MNDEAFSKETHLGSPQNLKSPSVYSQVHKSEEIQANSFKVTETSSKGIMNEEVDAGISSNPLRHSKISTRNSQNEIVTSRSSRPSEYYVKKQLCENQNDDQIYNDAMKSADKVNIRNHFEKENPEPTVERGEVLVESNKDIHDKVTSKPISKSVKFGLVDDQILNNESENSNSARFEEQSAVEFTSSPCKVNYKPAVKKLQKDYVATMVDTGTENESGGASLKMKSIPYVGLGTNEKLSGCEKNGVGTSREGNSDDIDDLSVEAVNDEYSSVANTDGDDFIEESSKESKNVSEEKEESDNQDESEIEMVSHEASDEDDTLNSISIPSDEVAADW